MTIRSVIIVPISGVDDDEKGKIFEQLIDICEEETGARPVVVLDVKTKWWGHDVRIKQLLSDDKIELIECLCVDTCQMWLEGWNHILSHDDATNTERVVLLPGDLVQIGDKKAFFNNLRGFITANTPKMLIGQFKIKEATGGKSLIDQYGVYPLLANWFPLVSKTIHGERIERPRSEFLNMDSKLLRKLLEKRCFAYEQTLNMIIRIVETPEKVGIVAPASGERMDVWVEKHIRRMDLGEVSDDSSSRVFLGCIDQIERTDRLLRFLWRELKEPPVTASEEEYREFLKDYLLLSRTSSDVRSAAMIAIRALLGT